MQNLLFDSADGNAELKIADFGFARDLQQNNYYRRKSEVSC